MLYFTVDMYHDFECSADACPSTCCGLGWNIDIDEETYQKMIEYEEQLGIPADDWLVRRNGRICVKQVDSRCPMLNENNLCNVVLKLGPDYMCEVCKLYPRMPAQYGDVYEIYLALSCPEVVARLMNKNEVLFGFGEDDTPAPEYPYTRLYQYESAVRTIMVDVFSRSLNISLSTRLFVSFGILDRAVESVRNDQMDIDLIQRELGIEFSEEKLLCLDSNLRGIVDENRRYLFLRQIQSAMHEYVFLESFAESVHRIDEYFSQGSLEQYLTDMQDFKAALEPYHAFYLNYWVYRIFADMMEIPDYEKVQEKFVCIAAGFCLIQIMALVSYVDKRTLDQEDYIYIISGISRMTEHYEGFRNSLAEKLRENNLISPVGLLLLTIE